MRAFSPSAGSSFASLLFILFSGALNLFLLAADMTLLCLNLALLLIYLPIPGLELIPCDAPADGPDRSADHGSYRTAHQRAGASPNATTDERSFFTGG